jgi:hypothetical protein
MRALLAAEEAPTEGAVHRLRGIAIEGRPVAVDGIDATRMARV